MVPHWLQQIIGPLVVATVIGLVGDRYRLGNTLDDMNETQLTQQIYIDRFTEFSTLGERFTFKDGEELREHMMTLAGQCEAASDEIQRLELDIARLPPSKWQERILRMENELHELRALIRIGNSRPGKSQWHFRSLDEQDDSPRAANGLGIQPMDITGDDRLPVKH